MISHESTSLVLLQSADSLTDAFDAWLRAYVAEPLTVATVYRIPEALAYLQSHRVDLILVDEAAARAELRMLHAASPATAIIGLVTRLDDAVELLMLRQGVHEVLGLLPSTGADQARILERALARVNGRAGLLKPRERRPDSAAAPPRLIHDLNNLLTSINGFTDLLLTQLPADNPARMSAEQIRLAGKRAAALLKAQSPGQSGVPSPASSAASSITAKAA